MKDYTFSDVVLELVRQVVDLRAKLYGRDYAETNELKEIVEYIEEIKVTENEVK